MERSEAEVLVPQFGNRPGAHAPQFGQRGEPAGPGLCLWCGGKLGAPKSKTPKVAAARGAYGDNAFCGLSCGYQFGVELAVRGRRLFLRAAATEPGPAPSAPVQP